MDTLISTTQDISVDSGLTKAHLTTLLKGTQGILASSSAGAISTSTFPAEELQKLLSLITNFLFQSETQQEVQDALLLLCNVARITNQESSNSIMLSSMAQMAPLIENLLEKTLQWKKYTPLHLILLLLIRIKNYKLEAADAMELLDGRVKLAVIGMTGLLKQQGYEEQVYANLYQMFHGLVEPASLYAHDESLELKHEQFTKHVDLVRELSLDLEWSLFDVMVNYFARLGLTSSSGSGGKSRSASPSPVMHRNMNAFCNFLLKLGYYGSSSHESSVFRKQFLIRDAEDEANSRGLAKLLMTYFESCLVQISNQGKSEEGNVNDALVGLRLVLKVLIYISFRQPSHLLLPLRYLNTTSAHFFMLYPKSLALQQYPVAVSSQLLALVCQFNVNINSLVGEGELRAHKLRVPPECKPSVLKSIINVCFESLPLDMMNTVRDIMEVPSLNMVSRDFTTYHSIMRLIEDHIVTLEKEQKPLNQSFNYEEIEDVLKNGLDSLEQEQQEMLDLKSRLQDLRKQQKDPSADKQQKEEPQLENKTSDPAPSNQSLTSLGNLPSLSATEKKVDSSIKALEKMEIQDLIAEQKIREQRRKTQNVLMKKGNVPSEFLCEINSHLMSAPVRTPYGNVYEKETIEMWLENNGQVDPLNGKVLKKDDLKADEALSRKISEWTYQQFTNGSVSASKDSDDMSGMDLYTF